MSKFSENPFVVWIGFIASLIGILVFITGKENLKEINEYFHSSSQLSSTTSDSKQKNPLPKNEVELISTKIKTLETIELQNPLPSYEFVTGKYIGEIQEHVDSKQNGKKFILEIQEGNGRVLGGVYRIEEKEVKFCGVVTQSNKKTDHGVYWDVFLSLYITEKDGLEAPEYHTLFNIRTGLEPKPLLAIAIFYGKNNYWVYFDTVQKKGFPVVLKGLHEFNNS